MKLKVPKRIKVAGHTYTIQIEEELARRHGKYGYYDVTNGVISIARDALLSCRNETIIHEVIHALSDFQMMGFAEEQIGRLANALWQVIDGVGIELDWGDIE